MLGGRESWGSFEFVEILLDIIMYGVRLRFELGLEVLVCLAPLFFRSLSDCVSGFLGKVTKISLTKNHSFLVFRW